ncbi:MAG: hypothetical protein M3O31_06520 [Acidobacteriota bacterium]|nr:hypothetical protein [Acidobacteriota bacterium]
MSFLPRLRTFVLALVAGAGLCTVAVAAQAAPPDAVVPAGVTDSLNNLADQPATHTGVVFDRSMIQMAQNMLEQGGMDTERAAAALTSISFDSYRYKEPAFYTPETMAFIADSYHRAGWKHLVNGNQTTANEAQPRTMITDVWLHFSGHDIDHVTVLTRGSKDMNLIQVAGDLRPLDLLHLSGHFGIPKVDPSAVMVPAPNGR